MKILIYGANGYTGKLIIEKAITWSLDIIISGRNEKEISKLAKVNKINYFISTPEGLQNNSQLLEQFDILLNCAGPFSKTAKPIINACLSSKTHYLDITGEIDIFRLGKSLDKKAKESNIVICPGVGFDVIPTDCLAVALSEKLLDANELVLGFESTAKKISPGTMSTSIESLGHGGKIRKNGKIVSVPLVYKTQKMDFGNGAKTMATIPWGDVATSYYSTNIKNISVYIPMHEKQIKQLKFLRKFSWLVRTQFIQYFMKKKVKKNFKGPNSDERKNSKTFVWGQVRKGNEVFEGKLVTENGYDVTANGSLAIINYITENEITGGYYTPSQLCGKELVEQLPESTKIEIKKVSE